MSYAHLALVSIAGCGHYPFTCARVLHENILISMSLRKLIIIKKLDVIAHLNDDSAASLDHIADEWLTVRITSCSALNRTHRLLVFF